MKQPVLQRPSVYFEGHTVILFGYLTVGQRASERRQKLQKRSMSPFHIKYNIG